MGTGQDVPFKCGAWLPINTQKGREQHWQGWKGKASVGRTEYAGRATRDVPAWLEAANAMKGPRSPSRAHEEPGWKEQAWKMIALSFLARAPCRHTFPRRDTSHTHTHTRGHLHTHVHKARKFIHTRPGMCMRAHTQQWILHSSTYMTQMQHTYAGMHTCLHTWPCAHTYTFTSVSQGCMGETDGTARA